MSLDGRPARPQPAVLPLGPPSITALVEYRARERPHTEALVDGRRRLTYAALKDRIDRVAAGLAALGLQRDDRIAVSLPNSADAVIAYCAAMRLGGCFVGVHPGLAANEKLEMLEAASADVALTTVSIADDLARSASDRPSSRAEVIGLDLDDLGIAAIDGPPSPAPPIDPFRPAALAFTSGTSGRPKAVVHDQHHMILPALVVSHDRLGGRSERVGVHLPLTTLNVLIVGPVLAFLGGGTCICLDRHDPSSLIDRITSERLDHLATSPAVVHDLVEHPDVRAEHLGGLRLGVGGTGCPEELRVSYRERFGRDFTTGYGLTEAPTSVTQETERIPHVAGASGRPMAHVEIEILGDAGDAAPPGVEGEITVLPRRTGRWANCWVGMHGYLDDSDATLRTLAGGRLRTGDIGYVDAAGYLHVTDRRSSVINRGGSKVTPAEVERVLLEHPDVADCIVLGRPDLRLGDVVAAAVQPRNGRSVDPSELAAHCRQRLAGFKVPSEWVVAASLPRNPMGKIQRGEVLELLKLATVEEEP